MSQEDIDYQNKLRAGMRFFYLHIGSNLRMMGSRLTFRNVDAKANKEMAMKAQGKGPMNTGQQGIKKSGKK